jgi:beta-carotene 3-hydroxylase
MYWWGPVVLFVAFFGMEFMAWATHKFLMHGGMWYFHRDHHQEERVFFEKNDVFFLIYALPSWLCIMLGMIYNHYLPVWIGYGIALYGFAYFLIHDVYIHRRFKWLRDIDHPYFMAIRKAHKIHHKYRDKEDGECFGMLIVPKKYYQEAKRTFQRKQTKG